MQPFVLLLCGAVLALAACATYDPPGAADGRILATEGVRPGMGTIDAVGVVPRARPAAPSASAGGSSDRNGYRLYVRMDDGGSQTVDQDNPTLMAGERIEIRADGRVVRPPQLFRR
jgi:hypothetical protein